MNIIMYKDTLYNTKSIKDEVYSNDYTNGFVLSATITNDGKIIVYNYAHNVTSYINNLQSENYNDLKNNSFYEIENFLEDFKDYSGKIIINLIGTPNVVGKPNKNRAFILKLKRILADYKHLDIYICSTYDDIITYVIRELDNIKKGMLVFEGNLNYYDVDFYMLPSRMFDTKIVAQQVKLNKEVMLVVDNSEDILPIVDRFKKDGSLFDGMDPDKCNDLIYIATMAPRIINLVLNNKKN